jgi:hypothetical protein
MKVSLDVSLLRGMTGLLARVLPYRHTILLFAAFPSARRNDYRTTHSRLLSDR